MDATIFRSPCTDLFFPFAESGRGVSAGLRNGLHGQLSTCATRIGSSSQEIQREGERMRAETRSKKNSIFVCFFLLPAEHKLYAAVLNEPSDNEVLFLQNKSIRFFLTFISLFPRSVRHISPFYSTYLPSFVIYIYICGTVAFHCCSGRSVDASMQRLSRNAHATQLPNNE